MTVFKKITNVLANLIEIKKDDIFDYGESRIRLWILGGLWTTSFIILAYIIGRGFGASTMQLFLIAFVWGNGLRVITNVFNGLCFDNSTKHNFEIVSIPKWMGSDLPTLVSNGCKFKVAGIPKSYFNNKGKGDTLKLTGVTYTQNDGLEAFVYTDENPVDETNNILVAMMVYIGLFIFFPTMGL